MRNFILSISILAGFAALAEEPQDVSRIREEEQREIREANESNSTKNQGGRQVERTETQNVGDAQRERQALTTQYETRLRAEGRTSPASNEANDQRAAEMRVRDAKQTETLRERETQRPIATPKAKTEYVQRNIEQQNTNDARAKDAQSAEQKLKAQQARQDR